MDGQRIKVVRPIMWCSTNPWAMRGCRSSRTSSLGGKTTAALTGFRLRNRRLRAGKSMSDRYIEAGNIKIRMQPYVQQMAICDER